MTDDPFAPVPYPSPAWGWRPDSWPPPIWFESPATELQLTTIASILDRRELVKSARVQLAALILSEFGVPAHQHGSKGASSLLIGFLTAGPVSAAESKLFGQEALF